jgi:hypothetical protein
MRSLALVVGSTLLLIAAGCSRQSAHEKLLKEGLGQLNELAEALEGVNDQPSADAALPKIEGIAKRMEDWQKRMKTATPEVSKSEDEKLKAKYDPEMKKAQERLGKALGHAIEKGGPAFAMQVIKVMANVK